MLPPALSPVGSAVQNMTDAEAFHDFPLSGTCDGKYSNSQVIVSIPPGENNLGQLCLIDPKTAKPNCPIDSSTASNTVSVPCLTNAFGFVFRAVKSRITSDTTGNANPAVQNLSLQSQALASSASTTVVANSLTTKVPGALSIAILSVNPTITIQNPNTNDIKNIGIVIDPKTVTPGTSYTIYVNNSQSPAPTVYNSCISSNIYETFTPADSGGTLQASPPTWPSNLAAPKNGDTIAVFYTATTTSSSGQTSTGPCNQIQFVGSAVNKNVVTFNNSSLTTKVPLSAPPNANAASGQYYFPPAPGTGATITVKPPCETTMVSQPQKEYAVPFYVTFSNSVEPAQINNNSLSVTNGSLSQVLMSASDPNSLCVYVVPAHSGNVTQIEKVTASLDLKLIKDVYGNQMSADPTQKTQEATVNYKDAILAPKVTIDDQSLVANDEIMTTDAKGNQVLTPVTFVTSPTVQFDISSNTGEAVSLLSATPTSTPGGGRACGTFAWSSIDTNNINIIPGHLANLPWPGGNVSQAQPAGSSFEYKSTVQGTLFQDTKDPQFYSYAVQVDDTNFSDYSGTKRLAATFGNDGQSLKANCFGIGPNPQKPNPPSPSLATFSVPSALTNSTTIAGNVTFTVQPNWVSGPSGPITVTNGTLTNIASADGLKYTFVINPANNPAGNSAVENVSVGLASGLTDIFGQTISLSGTGSNSFQYKAAAKLTNVSWTSVSSSQGGSAATPVFVNKPPTVNGTTDSGATVWLVSNISNLTTCPIANNSASQFSAPIQCISTSDCAQISASSNSTANFSLTASNLSLSSSTTGKGICVYAMDALGNIAATLTPTYFSYNPTASSAAFDPITQQSTNSTYKLTVPINCASPSQFTANAFTVSLNGTNNAWGANPAPISASCNSPAVFDLTNYPDTSFTISATASDIWGNIVTVASTTYTKSTVHVSKIQSSNANNNNYVNMTSGITYTVTCGFDTGLHGNGTVTPSFTPALAAGNANITSLGTGVWNVSVRSSNLSNGNYSVSFTCSDGVSTSPLSNAQSFTAILAPPSAPTSTASYGYFPYDYNIYAPSASATNPPGFHDQVSPVYPSLYWAAFTDALGNPAAKYSVYLQDAASSSSPLINCSATPITVPPSQANLMSPSCGSSGQLVDQHQYKFLIIAYDVAGNSNTIALPKFTYEQGLPAKPIVAPISSTQNNSSGNIAITLPSGTTTTLHYYVLVVDHNNLSNMELPNQVGLTSTLLTDSSTKVTYNAADFSSYVGTNQPVSLTIANYLAGGGTSFLTTNEQYDVYVVAQDSLGGISYTEVTGTYNPSGTSTGGTVGTTSTTPQLVTVSPLVVPGGTPQTYDGLPPFPSVSPTNVIQFNAWNDYIVTPSAGEMGILNSSTRTNPTYCNPTKGPYSNGCSHVGWRVMVDVSKYVSSCPSTAVIAADSLNVFTWSCYSETVNGKTQVFYYNSGFQPSAGLEDLIQYQTTGSYMPGQHVYMKWKTNGIAICSPATALTACQAIAISLTSSGTNASYQSNLLYYVAPSTWYNNSNQTIMSYGGGPNIGSAIQEFMDINKDSASTTPCGGPGIIIAINAVDSAPASVAGINMENVCPRTALVIWGRKSTTDSTRGGINSAINMIQATTNTNMFYFYYGAGDFWGSGGGNCNSSSGPLSTGSTANSDLCFLHASNSYHLWIEGVFSGDTTSGSPQKGISLYKVQYSQLHNVIVNNFNQSVYYRTYYPSMSTHPLINAAAISIDSSSYIKITSSTFNSNGASGRQGNSYNDYPNTYNQTNYHGDTLQILNSSYLQGQDLVFNKSVYDGISFKGISSQSSQYSNFINLSFSNTFRYDINLYSGAVNNSLTGLSLSKANNFVDANGSSGGNILGP